MPGPPNESLGKVFDQLAPRERELVLNNLRKTYLYARSAAQRALARAHDKTSSDAMFETIWWVSVCDSFIDTVVPKRWRSYKGSRPWGDLINGIMWARNQTLHDPLALAAVEDRWEVVNDTHRRWEESRWARHVDIPIADERRENAQFALAYRRALEGRIILDTLEQAVEVMRMLSIDEVIGSPST